MENLEINYKKKNKPFNVKILAINIGIFILIVLIITLYVMCFQLFFE